MRAGLLGVTFVVAGLAAGPAVAAPPVQLVTKTLPIELPPARAGELGGHTIFMNRCVGGCTIRPGIDDASTNTSIIASQVVSLAEYDFPEGEWEATVACMREIYSPYNVTVVDERPPAGTSYEQIVVAGRPQDFGFPAGVGGVGSMSPGCAPIPRGMAFAFTSAIEVFAAQTGGNRVHGLCWIVAQETAHNFGLDHQYSWVDDETSTCNDPMTYRFEWGGQKFFRPRVANVGAAALCGNGDPANFCRCGDTQNSHEKLLEVFGAAASIVPAPEVTITTPSTGALANFVAVTAGSERGVARLELFLNGWRWATEKGKAFGSTGQLIPSSYGFTLPASVPDGAYDIVVKAYDDLGIVGESAVVTAVKGAPCESADSCLTGQQCEEGKCFWEAPTSALGDACDYDQACVSELCVGNADGKVCSQACTLGAEDACPADTGLSCVDAGNGTGVCFPTDDGGCCSAHDTPRGAAGHLLLSFGVLGLIVVRRRRSR